MASRNANAAKAASKALQQILTTGTQKGGKRGLEAVGVEFRNEVVKMLSRPGTGRVYRRGSVLHRASRPGRPPAVDTGSYRSSWRWWMDDGYTLHVGTGDERGPWLEGGTVRMKPRPHLTPVGNRMRKRIPRIIGEEIAVEQRTIARGYPDSYGG